MLINTSSFSNASMYCSKFNFVNKSAIPERTSHNYMDPL